MPSIINQQPRDKPGEMVFLLVLLISDIFSASAGKGLLNPLKNLNLTGLSSKCQKDMETWIKGMAEFDLEFKECYLDRSKVCTEAVKKRLKQDFYAIKQLDSWGKLEPGLLDAGLTSYGSPGECREVSSSYLYQTQYCYAEASLPKDKNSTVSKELPPIKWAVCVPLSCNDQDILKIIGSISPLPLPFSRVSCVPNSGEITPFFWIFMSFLSILIIVLLISSAVDYYHWNYLEKPPRLSKKFQVLLAFSIYSNGFGILETTIQPEGHLKCLDCIRLFSMIWVVSGHMTVLWLHNDVFQPLTQLTHPILSETFTNAFFSVDTFFVLSGLLVSYMFFKTIFKKPRLIASPFTWLLFYVHRYLRLTPPYLLFVCFFMVIIPLLHGVNSVDFDYKRFVTICDKFWWRNLIYINNLDHWQSCYPSTWYLAADTQMYLISPIILLALYFNQFIGIGLILVIMAGSITLTFITIYHYDLPATFSHLQNADLFVEHLYTKPWIRITPYLLGLYLGFFIAKYGKSRKPRMHRILIILLWIFFLSMGLACIYGPYSYMDFHSDWSKFVRSFYYSFSRIGWGLTICWIILANYYGWGGPIASFMDHPLWQPFGRLSYSAYLVHLFVIMYYVNLSDKPIHFSSMWEQFLYYIIPITVISYFLSFFWSCLCEIPFLKLEKVLIEAITGPPRKEDSKN